MRKNRKWKMLSLNRGAGPEKHRWKQRKSPEYPIYLRKYRHRYLWRLDPRQEIRGVGGKKVDNLQSRYSKGDKNI